MRYVVRYLPDGKYFCSKSARVRAPEFARKYSTRDLALRFVRVSGFDRNEVSIEPLTSSKNALIEGYI